MKMCREATPAQAPHLPPPGYLARVSEARARLADAHADFAAELAGQHLPECLFWDVDELRAAVAARQSPGALRGAYRRIALELTAGHRPYPLATIEAALPVGRAIARLEHLHAGLADVAASS